MISNCKTEVKNHNATNCLVQNLKRTADVPPVTLCGKDVPILTWEEQTGMRMTTLEGDSFRQNTGDIPSEMISEQKLWARATKGETMPMHHIA